jgi:hypothetical protein
MQLRNYTPGIGYQIKRGKRGITGDTALHLGRWFDTGHDIRINLQKIMSYGWPRLRSATP